MLLCTAISSLAHLQTVLTLHSVALQCWIMTDELADDYERIMKEKKLRESSPTLHISLTWPCPWDRCIRQHLALPFTLVATWWVSTWVRSGLRTPEFRRMRRWSWYRWMHLSWVTPLRGKPGWNLPSSSIGLLTLTLKRVVVSLVKAGCRAVSRTPVLVGTGGRIGLRIRMLYEIRRYSNNITQAIQTDRKGTLGDWMQKNPLWSPTRKKESFDPWKKNQFHLLTNIYISFTYSHPWS